MELLLNAGATPDIEDFDGDTPLALTVRSENEKIIKLLLAKNADANWTNYFDESPLMWASKNGLDHFIQLLRAGNT